MMNKTNKILWPATLLLALAACRNEEITSPQTVQDKGTYTLHCIMDNGIQSRAQVQLGNTDVENEFAVWNSNDSFVVYDHADISDTDSVAQPKCGIFSIAPDYLNETPGNTADFTSDSPLTDGNTITAIYPVQTGAIDKGNITLFMSNYAHDEFEEGTAAEWQDYMSRTMYMYATGTVEGNNATLNFKHLCSLARITYTNMTNEARQIHSCILSGDGKYFGEKVEMNVKTGSIVNTPYKENLAGVHFNKLTVTPGDSCDIYLLFFPGDPFNENGTLTFQMSNDLSTPPMEVSTILEGNPGSTGFEAGKRYWFNVVQTEEGLVWKKDLLITNLKLIEAAERNPGISFVKNEQGYVDVIINKEMIEKVDTILLNDSTVTTMDGIEYFTNLHKLDCSKSSITELDLSKNMNLQTVNCSRNKLSQLVLGANSALDTLKCGSNQLTELDIAKCADLKVVWCYNNKLTQLNVKENTVLTELQCYRNLLTEVDVTNNSELVSLQCDENALTSLDVTNNKKLEILYCAFNKIAELNTDNNTLLKDLICAGNSLTTLNVLNNTNLERLALEANAISQVDISKNTRLRELSVSENKITSIDISHCTLLADFRCDFNLISQLDLSKNVELTYFSCGENRLQTLDITKNEKLNQLMCHRQYDRSTEPPTQIILTLSLTAAQKIKWDNQWDKKQNDVNLNVQN